jgi:microcystin-dependent protein
MTEPFLAEVRIFSFNFAPRGWAFCNGQLMPIQQNTALFSLLGVTYGGDGRTTFGLPNLQGSAPLHEGQGPGLSPRVLGEVGGSATVTLLQAEMPLHTHTLILAESEGTEHSPQGQLAAANTNAVPLYTNTPQPSTAVNMNLAGVTPLGGSQPHNNMMPYLTLNFCIALEGIFPPRP